MCISYGNVFAGNVIFYSWMEKKSDLQAINTWIERIFFSFVEDQAVAQTFITIEAIHRFSENEIELHLKCNVYLNAKRLEYSKTTFATSIYAWTTSNAMIIWW